MKAVIYARYSSDNQREESIEGQLRECTAYCKKNNITILRTYIDRAMSAKTDNRPDFQRMIKDSAKGLFDVVIVWKLDRFARNRYDSAHYKAQLRKYGVKVLSATENISEGPEGIILESMLEGMAEYYSAELSEKVIRGHTENALKCKYNGGTPTFGYFIDKDKQYQIDPRTAPVVLDIFTQYDKGATMKEIRDFLNAVGVTTVRGKPIDLNFVSHILHNRKFIGEYSYRDIVTPNGIPALVPQDLFDRVQERMAKNKKAPARHKADDDYLLTTKLFCGTCHAPMVGECGTSSSQKRKYHYYRCANTKKKKSCDAKRKTVRKLPIENAVVNAVMEKIMDDNFVAYITDTVMEMQTHESSLLPALRKQLEETERGITNMLNAIQAGIFNASTKQRLDELEQRKADIELQIIQEEMRHPMLTREDVTYWFCRYRMLDTKRLEERRRLIDGFVNSVIVYDEYIVITFNYKEGTTTVPFSKLDSSDLSSVGGPTALVIDKLLRLFVIYHEIGDVEKMAQDCNKTFRKAVTIFLDILGSQDRTDFSEWHKVMSIFSDTIAQEKQLDSTHPHTIYKREIHVFSDCAYIIYDYKPEIEESRKDAYALMCIACYNTEKVIMEFLRNGFIARGALTYGDIYYDNDKNVWFGPAMNRAYGLESKKARYPRLIIDPEFATGLYEFNKKNYQQNELQKQLNGEIIKKDDDGVFYLHYLNTYELGIGITQFRDFPAQILDMCKTEIEKPRETPELKHSIEEKYKWLQRYIQQSCYNN